MIRKILQDNRTLREMFPGILLYGIVVQIVLAVFFPPRLYRAAGLWAGVLCGCVMAVHMAWCLEKAVELDEKSASAYVKKTTLIRYAVVVAVMLLIAMTGLGDPVSLVLGTLGLKIGAYLQPLSHKVISKLSGAGPDQRESEGKEGE